MNQADFSACRRFRVVKSGKDVGYTTERAHVTPYGTRYCIYMSANCPPFTSGLCSCLSTRTRYLALAEQCQRSVLNVEPDCEPMGSAEAVFEIRARVRSSSLSAGAIARDSETSNGLRLAGIRGELRAHSLFLHCHARRNVGPL